MFDRVRLHGLDSDDFGAALFSIGLAGVVAGLAWLLVEATHMPLPPLSIDAAQIVSCAADAPRTC